MVMVVVVVEVVGEGGMIAGGMVVEGRICLF
jgi:hypothetical protein